MRELRLALCALICLSAAPVIVAQEGRMGFSGMEFYKLDWDTHSLKIADVNGDGLKDIVVANNARARIECLLQRADPSAPLPPRTTGVNDLPDDRRFRLRSLITEKKIYSLALGDLNGDGRTDLAYYGDPRELAVHYQDDKGEWGARRRFDIRDGATLPGAMEAADLNGDGREDLVLMAADGTYFLYQDAQGRLESPVKDGGLPQGAVALTSRDLDGDGRKDLAYLCTIEEAPFCFRFQNDAGGLGPEIACGTGAVRSAALRDLNNDGRMELAAVQQLLGRLVINEWTAESVPGAILDGSLERYSLRASTRRPASLAFAPFLEPERHDILVSDPDAAEILLYVQAPNGSWQRRGAFPTLQGISDMAAIRAKDAPRSDVLLLSPDEPMLGIAAFDPQGVLAFPSPLPVPGKPVCMAAEDLDGDGQAEVLCGTVEDKDRVIHILARDGDSFVERKRIALREPKTDPDGLMVADANQDGLKDILVFFPHQEMRVLKAAPEGEYVDVSFGPEYGRGLVQGLRKKSVALGDVTGDGREEILMTSKNFARALCLDAADRLKVVEQLNGRSSQSQILGGVVADLTADGVPEVILVDAGHRCLTALQRSDVGAYEIAENVDIGAANVSALFRLPPAQGMAPALLLLGANDFRVLRPGAPRIALRETASYESGVRNGSLELTEMADLDQDGRTEVIVTESTESLMEILVPEEGDGGLRAIMSWPIFETKVFPGSDQPASVEPREFDIGDVTNDGKPDIVLLVHDRVLVYVQE